MSFSIGSAIAALMLLHPARAAAQSSPERFELGVQLPVAASGEFDRTDAGIGGRFAWRPTTLVGVEAEIDLYPRDFPDGVAFSRGRTEGLFGVTAGPALRRVRPFARLRPGFVEFREAPAPVACILIFPPPLSCSLAAGRHRLCARCRGRDRRGGHADHVRPRRRRRSPSAVSGPGARLRRQRARGVIFQPRLQVRDWCRPPLLARSWIRATVGPRCHQDFPDVTWTTSRHACASA